VRFGDDPKDVHAMRVAAQRMRTGLRFFGPWLGDDPATLRADLGVVRRHLGALRDLDVQLAQLASWRAELGEWGAALAPLQHRVQRRRVEERFEMLRALDSEHSRQTLARIEGVIAACDAHVDRAPIGSVAGEIVRRAQRRARRAARHVGASCPDKRLHRLRRRLRQLRYVVEFHEPLYGPSAVRFVARLVKVQDALGAVQDGVVARTWLRELIEAERERLAPETIFAVGRLDERYARRAADVRRSLGELKAELGGRPWRRLREAMDALAG
jgi:CHAD domain-containing protein